MLHVSTVVLVGYQYCSEDEVALGLGWPKPWHVFDICRVVFVVMVLVNDRRLVVVVFPGPLKEYGIRDGDMLLLQRVQGERGQPMAGRQLSPSAPSQSSSGAYCHDRHSL